MNKNKGPNIMVGGLSHFEWVPCSLIIGNSHFIIHSFLSSGWKSKCIKTYHCFYNHNLIW